MPGVVWPGGTACRLAGRFSSVSSAVCVTQLVAAQGGSASLAKSWLLSCAVGALLGDGLLRGGNGAGRRFVEGLPVGMVSAGGAVRHRHVARRAWPDDERPCDWAGCECDNGMRHAVLGNDWRTMRWLDDVENGLRCWHGYRVVAVAVT